MSQRIQLRRTKGWRKPVGAVVVARPSRWGNPIRVTAERSEERGRVMYRVHGSPKDISGGPSYNGLDTARHFAAGFFEADLLNGVYGTSYPSVEEIRSELAGRDLACWCPLDQPCHADVLLEIANSGDPSGGAASGLG